MRNERGNAFVLLLALLFALGGGLLAWLVQTDYGAVRVDQVRFAASDGRIVNGRLYRPALATADAPAPAVLAVHGYINSEGTQAPYAIELSRRGYVVLSIDQPGHGYSDAPAFAGGFGGIDGLAYLRSLPFVDLDQVVLSGHSMGGWAAIIAAAVNPDGYTSVIVSGSSTGTFGAPDGTPTFPRNFGLVFGAFDEFSQLMWGSATGEGILQTAKLRSLFDTDAPVVPGTTYGSIGDGTARWLAMPTQNHPTNHITTAGVAPVIDWVQRTTTAPFPLPPEDQVWMWREAGTGLGLLGFIFALFGLSGTLLVSPAFGGLRLRVPPAAGLSGFGWWIGAAVATAIPALTYFWATEQAAALLPASRLFPQTITSELMGWALLNGAITLVLVLLWWVTAGRRRGARADTLGLAVGGFFRAVWFALLVVGGAHALLALVGGLFQVDFRVWVVAQKLLSQDQALIALSYVLPFTLFFLVFGMLLHGQLRPSDSRAEGADAMIANALIAVGGFIVLLLVQYLPVVTEGQPLTILEPLRTIVAYQFIVLLPVAAMLSTYLFARTGSVWPGAFVNGFWVTAYIVASQATQFAG
jgi:pimeloyl-ACP methyl ester carboxylesterase